MGLGRIDGCISVLVYAEAVAKCNRCGVGLESWMVTVSHIRGGIDNLTRFSVGELDGSCLLGEHDFRKCFFGSNSVT